MNKENTDNSKNSAGLHPLYTADLEFEDLQKNQKFTEEHLKKVAAKKLLSRFDEASNISVCITVLNEDRTIGRLLESLLNQTIKYKELIIVDGGSTDQTINIIKHFQEKQEDIKLIIEKSSRAKGRNLSIKEAKGQIIAITDAGCIAEPDWLDTITQPFRNKDVEVVAGFYDMRGDKPIQKAFSIFLGTIPSKFDSNFLPSTRSIAFRRKVWEKLKGFPETMNDTAEDTLFNFNVLREGYKFTRIRKARVEWLMPDDLFGGLKKMYNYAVGDAKSQLWIHPEKGLITHNVRVLTKFVRYILGIMLLILGFYYPVLITILIIAALIYILNSFMKVYLEYEDITAGMWGIVIQFTSDFSSMAGFLNGMLPSGDSDKIKSSVLTK